MKKILTVAVVFGMISAFAADEIKLPAPQKSGGMSVREALSSRRTVRKFQDKELSLQQIADMLWSANGVNRPDGKRTAPSALNRQNILVYAALKDGAYLYDPHKHALIKVSDKDLRSSCGRFTAPCYIVLVGDLSKDSREIAAAVNGGYVSQNIYLAATANGLGTCAMGSIADKKELVKELKLGKNTPYLVHPVGFPL